MNWKNRLPSELTGWQPCHLALYEGDPASTEETSPLAVMPLYRNQRLG